MSHATAADYFKPRKLFSRTDWGAKPSKKKINLKTPVKWIVIKHTLTDTCTKKEDCEKLIREIQLQDMDERGHSDIQYNFLISSDGTMYEGRGWDAAPDPYPENEKDKQDNINETSFLVGMIGDPRDGELTSLQEISVLNILGKGVQNNTINENVKFLREHEVGYDELGLETDDDDSTNSTRRSFI